MQKMTKIRFIRLSQSRWMHLLRGFSFLLKLTPSKVVEGGT